MALYDVIPDRVTRTLEGLLEQLHGLSRGGLLRGTLGVEEQWGRIRGVQDLGECVTGAIWVQVSQKWYECKGSISTVDLCWKVAPSALG